MSTLAQESGPAFAVPPGIPLFGQIFDAWKNPLELFTRVTREHGDMVKLRFAWLDYYLVNDPRGAHRVLVENAKGYEKSVNYQGLKVMLGQGLLTSEGDFWKRQRKLAQPAFHRERIAGFVQTMAQCTEDAMERWAREVPTEGGTLDVHAEMNRLTFRIVGKTLMSTDLDGDARAFGDALHVALAWANDYVESIVRVPPTWPTPKNRRFRAAQRTIESVVGRVIEERRKDPSDTSDLLGMLMAARDEGTNDGMTDRHLLDELLTLTLAGHETTSNALSFTLYLLAEHPEELAIVRAEIDEVLGGRTPTFDDVPKLPRTRAVIDESLRLYPPAWVVERQTLEDDVVLGHRIPKGSVVAVSPWALHRSERLWKDPERFDPSRFDAPDPERHKLTYMPFGGGPRTCIGNVFALTEMAVVLPMILARYDVAPAPDFTLDLEKSVTLRPRAGVKVRLTPRREGPRVEA